MIRHIRDKLAGYTGQTITCEETIKAGAVIPLFEDNGEVFLVLTKRSEKVRFHKGEVSLPGGMYERQDRDIMDTALRECCEEIGVCREDIEIIGRINDVHTVTGFVITPYVGIIPYPYEFQPNPDEVAYIILLPCRHLKVQNQIYEEVHWEGKTHKTPAFYYKGERIWGATCRMLLDFRNIVDEKI